MPRRSITRLAINLFKRIKSSLTIPFCKDSLLFYSNQLIIVLGEDGEQYYRNSYNPIPENALLNDNGNVLLNDNGNILLNDL